MASFELIAKLRNMDAYESISRQQLESILAILPSPKPTPKSAP